MSMIGNFRMSTDSEIGELLAHPDAITSLLYPDEEAETEPTAGLDVDKAWHAIHFLLCASPWGGDAPLNFIVSGGAEVGDVDVGYGPARVFTSGEVGEIVRALEPITGAQLRSRFDAAAFAVNEIYPDGWVDPAPGFMDEYVLHYFELLRDFLRRTHAEGKALIVYLN